MYTSKLKDPQQLTCDFEDVECFQRQSISNVEILFLDLKYCSNLTAEDYNQKLDRIIQRVKSIRQLKQLILNIQMDCMKFDGVRDKFVDFLKDDIVKKHSSSLELLNFMNFKIKSYKIVFTEYEKFHIDLLSFILSNLTNLTGIIFQISNIIYSINSIMLSSALDLIYSNTQNFSKLTYLKVEVCSQGPTQFMDSQKYDWVQYLIKQSNKLSQIQSINKLEIIIADQNLDSVTIQKVITNIIEIKNLNSFGIDITGNKQNVKQSISYIQQISQKKSNLKELTFIDNKMLSTQQEIDSFIKILQNFTNLSRIQLEGYGAKKQKAQLYLTFLENLPQLTQIVLDLSLIDLNEHNFTLPFKQLSVFNQLEVLQLTLPSIIDLKRKQVQTLANLIEAQSQTLKDLFLSFQLDQFNFEPFQDTFPQLKQLQRIQIEIILKKLTIDFIIEINSELQGQTIFDLQHFETTLNYCDKKWVKLYNTQISALQFLKLIIIQEANNIKKLEIEDMNFYQYDNQNLKLLSKLFQFNNIHELTILNVQGTSIILKLLNCCKNSLKSLVIDYQNCILSDDSEDYLKQENELIQEEQSGGKLLKRVNELIFQRMLKCQQLQRLWLFQECFEQNNLFLSQILTRIPQLSSLEVSLSLYQFNMEDALVVLNYSTLTRIRHNDFLGFTQQKKIQSNPEIKQLELITNGKMAQIQSILIFHQHISSILNVDPSICIWDLFL